MKPISRPTFIIVIYLGGVWCARAQRLHIAYRLNINATTLSPNGLLGRSIPDGATCCIPSGTGPGLRFPRTAVFVFLSSPY